MATPTAALLSIGDELALGQTLDTNSAWMADRLFLAGVRVVEHATVEDDVGLMAAAFRRLGADVDLIVCTGGLGPTADDLTREVVSELIGSPLVEDPASLAHLEGWFAGRGGLPAINRVQAYRPEAGESLENPHGTAPGLRVRDESRNTEIFCMPGPPHEMRPMFERYVVPHAATLVGGVMHARLLLTFGLGESKIAEILGPMMDRDRAGRGLAVVGTTASKGVVTCRMRATAADAQAAGVLLDDAEREILERFDEAGIGGIVFDRRDIASGDDGAIRDALPRAVVGLLREQGQTVAVVESCTGGLLGAEITSIAGSSDVFVGGWQTYSNEMKTAMVGVPSDLIKEHGAVSGECARAMADGALARLAGAGVPCDHTVAITGVAGPGASESKPAGTVWIACAGGGQPTEARRFTFRGDRAAVRDRSVRAAMGVLRLRVLGIEMEMLSEAERALG